MIQAIVKSKERAEPHLHNVHKHTIGIVFLGTPHHGSALARWGLWMSQMVGLVRYTQTNPEIIRVLQSNSEELARIQDSFHAVLLARRPMGLEPIDITCCYEELPMGRLGLVRSQAQACFSFD
jgi:protein SERAC1